MSNQMSNAPMMSSGPKSFIQVWMDALTKPNEQNYADMAAAPGASAGKAYLWVFLTSLVSYFIIALVQFAVAGLGGNAQGSRDLTTSLVSLICAIPIGAGFVVLGFMIGTALIQWVAGMFKGAGTFGQLAYVFGAISAPVTLVSSVLSLFYAIPFLGLCLWPVSIIPGLYVLVLEVIAVKGVNRFGWGEAIGSVLIPGLVLGCLVALCVFVALMALGPAIGNVFSTINQSLQSVP
ncbi:MAG: YIP1 family protein [Chloroflexi bacterium]|nr:YIP1 family protein [Chloroflexota bacterium]